MINFITTHWPSILIVLGAAAGIVLLIVRKEWGLLDKIMFAAVTWAEREYGTGTGALKLAAVVERVYPMIPAVIRFFLTEAALTRLIENALAAAKARWDANPALLASTTEKSIKE